MRKALATTLGALALAGGTLMAAAPANAAHCADNGGPGNSDFAAHVQSTKGTAHNEGDHRGWSSCQETSKNYAP